MSIFPFLFLSCRKAAALIDKSASIGLSRKEKIRLFIHQSICTGCTCYEKQSEFIDLVAKRMNTIVSAEKHLPEDVKLRILKKINTK